MEQQIEKTEKPKSLSLSNDDMVEVNKYCLKKAIEANTSNAAIGGCSATKVIDDATKYKEFILKYD